MDNTITYKKIIIIACVVSILLGVFMHFAFNLSGNNTLVGLITPVNESVWEHLKLIFVPLTLFSIGFYFYSKKKFSNMLLISFLSNVVGMFTTVVLYYLGLAIFNTNSMTFNIISYILSMIISYVILYLGIYNKDFIAETIDSTAIGACALTLFLAVFILNTYSPIKLDITKDPTTNTYGMVKKT